MEFNEGDYDGFIFIAAHAVVHNDAGREETAWGNEYGVRFSDNTWAMYMAIPLGRSTGES